jgi:TatD DNase family protein
LIDTHYHLEAVQDPARAAQAIESHRVLTVAVTNLPTAYEAFRLRFRDYRFIRPALGLHPLLAARHANELPRFRDLLPTTSFIGEVGLDFSRKGSPTRDAQIQVFVAILKSIRGSRRFVTVHSRGAEAAVLDLLKREGVGPVVFHWYTGPLGTLDELLAAGHFCSINPAMVRSQRGRQIAARIPPERTLSETDGPYVTVRNGPATPIDVAVVVDHLAATWSAPREAVEKQLLGNLKGLLPSRGQSELGRPLDT